MRYLLFFFFVPDAVSRAAGQGGSGFNGGVPKMVEAINLPDSMRDAVRLREGLCAIVSFRFARTTRERRARNQITKLIITRGYCFTLNVSCVEILFTSKIRARGLLKDHFTNDNNDSNDIRETGGGGRVRSGASLEFDRASVQSVRFLCRFLSSFAPNNENSHSGTRVSSFYRSACEFNSSESSVFACSRL